MRRDQEHGKAGHAVEEERRRRRRRIRGVCTTAVCVSTDVTANKQAHG
jgi:hypothetical protein